MISIDFECQCSHRFDVYFKDYDSYRQQLEKRMVACPLCNANSIKRIYTGCSIHARSNSSSKSVDIGNDGPNFFDFLRSMNNFIKKNYDNVGSEFADTARAMHYGLEEERNIIGDTTLEEINELTEEGISTFPLIDLEKQNN